MNNACDCCGVGCPVLAFTTLLALFTAPPGAAASTHILPHSPSDAAHPSGGCLGEYLEISGHGSAWKIVRQNLSNAEDTYKNATGDILYASMTLWETIN